MTDYDRLHHSLFGCKGHYIKFSPRKAMDIATLGCSILIKEKDGLIKDLKIAYGVAGPTPLRAIDAENYALKKLETSSKKQNEGSGTIIWKPINNKWFLVSENLKVKMGDSRFETAKKDSVKKDEKQKFKTKKFGNFLYVKNQYFDFETNIAQQKSDFSGYSLEVKNADGSLLSQYRTDSLSARESATYQKIDTLVKKADFEKRVSAVIENLKGITRSEARNILNRAEYFLENDSILN